MNDWPPKDENLVSLMRWRVWAIQLLADLRLQPTGLPHGDAKARNILGVLARKAKPPPKGKINSRAKGSAGEREWVQYFSRWFPGATRGLSQTAGAHAPDVDHTPFWIESKLGKAINLMAAYRQAQSDLEAARAKGRYLEARPLVVARYDKQPGMVLISAKDFGALLDLAYGTPGADDHEGLQQHPQPGGPSPQSVDGRGGPALDHR